MMHVIQDKMFFYMYLIVFLNNPLSANMCQLRQKTSSKGSLFFTQTSIKNR